MKVREVAKINIELSEEEAKCLYDTMELMNKIGDSLDAFGVFTQEYEDAINNSLGGIQDILDAIEEGFERKIEE